MAELCTIADVEALAGYDIPDDQHQRVDTLIGFASAVVAESCVQLPTPPPEVVTLVTAQLVVRQLANPTAASSETIGAYQVGYGPPGMQLTDADYDLLGTWLAPTPGRGAYSVWTPSPFAVDDFGYAFGFIDFSRDDALVIPAEDAS